MYSSEFNLIDRVTKFAIIRKSMKNTYCEKAYAKVNFNLRVFPKRADGINSGYHDIESIFQTVDLYDELMVCVSAEPGCKVTCDSMVLPENNTLVLAYKAFCEIAGVEVPGISVKLKKGIPAGGGLGGGSSDAAALVRVLENICGLKLTVEQIDYIAGKTGSDVFFFMYCDSDGTGTALVSGRGENVKRIQSRKDLLLLLVFPEISSSTKEAYALVDEMLEKAKTEGRENEVKYPDFNELEAVYRSSPEAWNFINTFTPALCGKYNDIKSALKVLRKTGAKYSEMSGSGSTVFGVFTSEQQATDICNLLGDSWNCVLARTL